MASNAKIISVPRELLAGSTLFLVNATGVATLPTNFPEGELFSRKTKVTKSIEAHLPNNDRHVLIALPSYWPVTCGKENTVEGKPCDTVHDHFRVLGNGAHDWMSVLTCTR